MNSVTRELFHRDPGIAVVDEPRRMGRFDSRAGITDTAYFKDCLQGDSAAAVVQHDMAIGSQLNITGTPIFVNRARTAPGSLPEWMLDSLVGSSSTQAGK